jgi:hypothetical protein
MKARRHINRSYERKEAITPIEYGGLQQAYDHFNAAGIVAQRSR